MHICVCVHMYIHICRSATTFGTANDRVMMIGSRPIALKICTEGEERMNDLIEIAF